MLAQRYGFSRQKLSKVQKNSVQHDSASALLIRKLRAMVGTSGNLTRAPKASIKHHVLLLLSSW